jgi:hypothetical protein
MNRKHLKFGGITLRVPFYVDVLSLSENQIDYLMNDLQNILGARYFRTLELSREVLTDFIERSKGVSWSKAYLHVWLSKDNELRVGAANKVEEGSTVHSFEQVYEYMHLKECAAIRERDEEIEGLIDSNIY